MACAAWKAKGYDTRKYIMEKCFNARFPIQVLSEITQPMDSHPLPRGKACLPCRYRRIKCDGVKPTCSRCKEKGRLCQYSEEKSGQELQQEVVALESRVREAELRKHIVAPTLGNAIDFNGIPSDWWMMDEPPVPMWPHLVEIFFHFAESCGFFLDPERFAQSFYARGPFGHSSRPSRALLSAVYLTSIAFSRNATLMSHEPIFLSRALYYASQAPSYPHPSNAKHGLQAEILIANYFFWRGHIQEGKSHINTAMLISLVHRAHKISRIPNPARAEIIDQLERVKGFWSAYLLDKAWSVAGGLPSSSPDGLTEESRIDAPWPLELQQFKNVHPEQEVQGYDTINRFLANPSSSFAEEDVSKFSMACKAVTLLDRAHSLGLSWAAARDDETRADLTAKVIKMRHATQTFKDTIAPLPVGANIQDALVIIHAMAILASIRLDTSPTWSEHSVESALAAVALVDSTSFKYIGHANPILGFLLTAIGQVLVDELARIHGLVRKTKDDIEQEAMMKNAADRLAVALRACGAESPYVSDQHLKFAAQVRWLS
ncbi:hypothetical protein BJ322DRAFT_1108757 [Thelephora terrestris]|uniref:Zn(2)-C6 fungal-type domain-containing protein n=1 Tax=Thelephora terrestris TaxID=56493 RepID=A0A9P6HEE6_9AGAM|nr:hypothetical protein BJ322DRAFT_1108757 [Thelephora terrestris]